MARDFRKMKIFHLSYNFLLKIYTILPALPEHELRNIYSQLQRASTSVVLNIVEGAANRSNKVFFNHLQYSYGSAKEVEVLLMLCYDLCYIQKDIYEELVVSLDEVKAKLFKFMTSVDKQVSKRFDNYSFQDPALFYTGYSS